MDASAINHFISYIGDSGICTSGSDLHQFLTGIVAQSSHHGGKSRAQDQLHGAKILVSFTNHGYLDMAINFVEALKRIGVYNFVMFALDKPSFERLKALKIETWLLASREETVFTESSSSFGTPEFNSICNVKPWIVLECLKGGFDVVWTDTDVIWLKDAQPFFDKFPSVDLQLQGDDDDICAGFFYARSTLANIILLTKVIGYVNTCMDDQTALRRFLLEEEGLANRLTQKHSDLAITTLEQWDTSPQFNLDIGKANYLVLPRALFPNGTAYYNVKLPQRFGVVPFIVHNNCIIGHDSKVDRFKMYGQWFIAESEDYDPTKDEKFHPTSTTPLVSLTSHREVVTCLSIHPDNTTIYTAAYDKTVKVYKTEHILQALNHASQTPLPTPTILRPSGGCLLNRRGGVWCMAWIPGHLGPENPEFASSSSSPTQVEDAATTIHVAAPTHPMMATIMGLVHSSTEAHKEHKSSAPSDALPLCATGGHDRHVMVFQTAHGLDNDIFANTGPWKQIHTMKGHQGVVNDLIFHRDSLFSCSDDGTVRSWNVKSGEKTRIYRGGSGWFSSLMVDGPALFAASSDGSCYAWDIASARLVQVYDPRHSRSGWIRSIAVDAARKRVYTAGSDGSITEWDMIQGEIIRTIHNAHSKGINTIKLIRSQKGNKDFNIILSASDDGLIRAWKLSTLRNVGQFDGHSGSVLTLLVTDSFFLSGGADHTIKVWALPNLD